MFARLGDKVEKLNINFEHCYGIKKLQHVFDFSNKSAFAIYAPNGAMKSSFARTFSDIAAGKESGDKIFPARICTRVAEDDTGSAISSEQILVVQPYDEVFEHSEKTSTLLVNAALRKEYESLNAGFEGAKDVLINAIKKQSGSKRDIEKEISSTFTKADNELYKALLRIEEELSTQKDAPFTDIPYDVVFDDKVVEFLEKKDVKDIIDEYITKYNELLDSSTYFSRGTFTYYNAGTIAKNLADNGFFEAKHTISLNAPERREISTREELEELIAQEKDSISSDAALKKKYSALEKLITKNTTLRDFERYLSDHEELLSKFSNVEEFREEVLKSYLKHHYDLYCDVVDKYKAALKRRTEIEAQAAKERTQWEEVIDIFNDRFYVPFKLVAQNRTQVILGEDRMLSLGFTFEDGAESVSVERSRLLEALSTGEKKALYILNIIFEIQARLASGTQTLMIVDDIADSFDYKNKYAIVQYLKDVAESPNFLQIILTHNFDFFRTVKGRFVGYGNCLMATKSSDEVTLNRAAGIDNVFVKDWKVHFHDDPKKRIASIPFMRNLVEFTKGEADPDYLKMTSLLHWKSDTSSLTHGDLFNIYNGLFGSTHIPTDPQKPVINEIFDQAEDCLNAGDGMNFENKIVLSIAIRLKAEQHMASVIDDPNFLASISTNQTGALLRRLRQVSPGEPSLSALDKVVLMTPENLHLNAFMYEPILDMSDEHLRRLYADVRAF